MRNRGPIGAIAEIVVTRDIATLLIGDGHGSAPASGGRCTP
jgi:hypothetical protein